MKRSASSTSQSKKKKEKSNDFQAIASLNNPLDSFFEITKESTISCSIICLGANKRNRFFSESSSTLMKFANKANCLVKPISMNFFGRGTQNAVQQIVAAYDCSFLLTGTFLYRVFIHML